ncbi:MAG: alkaline phosphatase D family protein [Bacteroidota bacterium]|nr:alkaline phosphatase D family protein [Bacteroidota bacterium]
MKQKISGILFMAFVAVSTALGQTKTPARIVAGPMLGYSTHIECAIWVQTLNANETSIQYRVLGSNGAWQNEVNFNFVTSKNKPQAYKFYLSELEMGKTYEYQILLDGILQKFPYPLQFKTQELWEWRKSAPDFSFLAGSCLYINDSAYDRPGVPYGKSTDILNSMANTSSDFMLWLGDNVYMREADYSSVSGMERRYLHTRSEPKLQPLLAKMNHYAIWDDHDYGDNDANKTFEHKLTSHNLFSEYWVNRSSNYLYEDGIYFSFKHSDAEFFMLDNRWFRDESNLNEQFFSKTQLGAKQLDWLKNKVTHSKAVFKFVCVGGQFLNEHTNKESFNLYKKERQEIIQFIVEQKISGVVFLTGDRHHTELIKNDDVKEKLGYSLYDLTSSSITAGPSSIVGSDEEKNPMRVANTLTAENNFCQIKISGKKKGERQLEISNYDAKGMVKWGFVIKESDLKAKK